MARKPFFSGNYGSALARVDTRPIMEAGRAQGQMFANMGQQIGGMIKQYGLNKEKQGKLTDKIENRLKLDPSIAQRLTMTGDEDFDKKNVTDMEKLASGELGLKGLQRLDSAMATINEVDLQKRAEQDREIANLYKTTLTKQVEQSTASKKLIDDLSKSKLEREDQLRKSYGAQGRTIIEQLKGSSNITQAFNKLTPGQQKLVRNLDAIESGVYDLEKLDFDPFDNQKFTTGNINIQKLLGEVDEQKIKSDKEQKGEKYYQQLEEELETDLSYQMGDFSKMTPRELWLASNESNIAQRQPLEKFDPSKVEEYKQAVLQTQQDTREGKGQEQIIDAGGIVAPQGALQMVDGQLSRIGTPAEQMTTQNFEQATQGIPGTPTIRPVDTSTAFRGQAPEMIEDFGNSVKMFFTGEPMDTFADGKNAVQQVQNLSTIKNTVQPILLNEFGGKITNFQMTQVQENIPLKTDSRAVGREKLENLVGLMESQLSKANLYLQTTKPGTENYADAAYVKRQIEANLPMLKQEFQSKQSYTTPANIKKILDSNKTKPSAQVDTNASNVDLSQFTIDQLLQMQNR
jgi:hypothetical protein